ncbi:helix-turn-helix domain-containing protein [Streptomyces sp. CRN 30]|uniref:helix-turn-helix domain-containing protein n=1 Tax=Streptomyces sp. CRN 30 TaxID=3075613 RepID=UPI002A8386BA|nr:helix-turn-helix domain-containing protein [Streptomyces sp. CRN 30]
MDEPSWLTDVARARHPGPAALPRDEVAELRAELRHLRAEQHTHRVVSHAAGVLLERYRLPCAETGLRLLRDGAQRHGLPVHVLAGAVLREPRYGDGGPPRLPGRRPPPPPLSFLGGTHDPVPRATVLAAALDRGLTVMGTRTGNLQSTGSGTDVLLMEHHHGFDSSFLDRFAVIRGTGTPCGRAADQRRPVVSHVVSDRFYTEPDREALLVAGSRTIHSVPLLSVAGRAHGVVSVHLDRSGVLLRRTEAHALSALATETGQWLAWHRFTTLLDALADLHRCAVTAPSPRASRAPAHAAVTGGAGRSPGEDDPLPGREPATVRRALSYMEAHAARPLTVGDLAGAVGISVRALQQAFARHRGTTPMSELRRVRLAHAHRELRAADPTRGATVAEIAHRWGFGRADRFAAAYRRVYGVPPSRTLRG